MIHEMINVRKLNIESKFKDLKYEAEFLQEGFGKNVSDVVNEVIEQIDAMQSFSENCDIAQIITAARDIEKHLSAIKVESDRILQKSKFIPTSKVFALNGFVEKTDGIVQELEDFTDINCSCKRK